MPSNHNRNIDFSNKSEKDEETKNFSVLEEEVEINKEEEIKRKINIHQFVTDEEVENEVVLSEENVTIERVEKNMEVESPPGIRSERNTTIIPVVKEEVVLTKKLILVEEIHIKKNKKEKKKKIKTTVQKTEVEIKNK